MRVQVPNIGPSLKIVDALPSGTPKRIGFSIQNPSTVDVYYSDDQRTLDSVSPANLPLVGHLLAAATPPLAPLVYPWFVGKQIFVRAQNPGASLEVIIYDVDLPCNPK